MEEAIELILKNQVIIMNLFNEAMKDETNDEEALISTLTDGIKTTQEFLNK